MNTKYDYINSKISIFFFCFSECTFFLEQWCFTFQVILRKSTKSCRRPKYTRQKLSKLCDCQGTKTTLHGRKSTAILYVCSSDSVHPILKPSISDTSHSFGINNLLCTPIIILSLGHGLESKQIVKKGLVRKLMFWGQN